MFAFFAVLAALSAPAPSSCSRPAADDTIVIADFEQPTYGDWTVTGEAFGPGPAEGTLPGQMPVTGFLGKRLVNSYYGGDRSVGTLTSPPFTIRRRYINFLIGGGKDSVRTCMNLLVDGRIERTATGPNDRPGGSERLEWASWDVADLQGRQATIQIVDRATGGWGHINVDQIEMSSERKAEDIVTETLYAETYRPQFHFSPAKGWTNDPNGLVYYQGEYHLFFQHNPFGVEWGNMTWGHAVSRDLVHWTQLANAIEPDALGTIFSGSAVVDHADTAGFRKGKEKAIVAVYTAAGGTSPESKGAPFTQCIAYSTDRGRTFTKYAGNPVLPHIAAENRDPKVVWHAPTRRWIMALYLEGEVYALFRSPDLKTWTELQRIQMPGCGECPDFFEMPVSGKTSVRKWVFTAANGRYLVGAFDGARFTPETDVRQVDYGANYYAVQTYSDIPPSDGRRIQIAWMNGGVYPQMPFNQQMSFPCVLTLRETPDGLRLFRWPVREISSLRGEPRLVLRDRVLKPGVDLLGGAQAELADIELVFEPRGAREVTLRVRGEAVHYDASAQTLSCLGRSAPLSSVDGRIRLRVLVDRTSLEVFGNGGRISMTSCFLPRPSERTLSLDVAGGAARLVSLTVTPLRSAWPVAP
jgi:sucrose-6-phosphate hydrolase SacC (GH32 family)